MDSGIILIIVLIIIGFAITWSNQGQVKEIEEQQTKQSIARQEMAKHDNRSSSDIDNDRNAMIATLEASITDEPEQLEKMKTIINDWADMKIKSFKNRRSWVRNPEDKNA
tara:strand:- start:1724 stop:2053 length:330 start_codon:yes stop_codon:yes gene_type:complete